jgi:hypothetical protein
MLNQDLVRRAIQDQIMASQRLLDLLSDPSSGSKPTPETQEAKMLTRKEFCLRQRISMSYYLKLARMGMAPDEIDVGIGNTKAAPRITTEAEGKWLQMMTRRAVKAGA